MIPDFVDQAFAHLFALRPGILPDCPKETASDTAESKSKYDQWLGTGAGGVESYSFSQFDLDWTLLLDLALKNYKLLINWTLWHCSHPCLFDHAEQQLDLSAHDGEFSFPARITHLWFVCERSANTFIFGWLRSVSAFITAYYPDRHNNLVGFPQSPSTGLRTPARPRLSTWV